VTPIFNDSNGGLRLKNLSTRVFKTNATLRILHKILREFKIDILNYAESVAWVTPTAQIQSITETPI